MERLGSIGLNSALIQDPAPPQEAANGGIHRKPADFGKPGAAGGGGPIWARGAGDRDPLFPEPNVGPPKPFNGGTARWGGNEPKKWAGVRPGDGERRNAAPVVGLQGATRRWDDTRAQGRPAAWVTDANESENWRGARAATRANDVPWRKGDGRRDGAGALPGGTFGGVHAALPGARAGAGMRPPQVNRAVAGAGPRYNKADLMDVFYKMKSEAGDEIPPPEDVIEADDFREIWRPLVDQHGRGKMEPAHISAPPGLDQNHMLKAQLERVANKFMDIDVPFPLQALHMDQYFYKDPSGIIQGPFPSLNLKSWDDQGYLYDELQCQSVASRDAFFPFSSLKMLWEIGENLGLQAGELERLADAEVQFKGHSTDHAEVMENGHDILNHHGGHDGVHIIAGVHGIDHVEQRMQSVGLRTVGEHAHMQNWASPVTEQSVEVHAPDPAQDVPYSVLESLQPDKPPANYDPIDDIIDEPNAARPEIDPRDGGRVLQPFGGMGSGVGVVEPVASMAQEIPVQQASEPAEPQQQPSRLLAADPILNIPVHVERAAAIPITQSTDPINTEPPHSAMPAQFISPSDLFGAKQAAPQPSQQAPLQSAVPRHAHAEVMPAYPAQSRPVAMQGAGNAPGARGWAAQPAPQQTGVPLADIQREELVKRQKEEAEAQAAAEVTALNEQQERERRAAWTTQPQPVPLRQIMEDEECAAELEGGYDAGKEDYAASGYNPWQGQAALPQEHEAQVAGASGAQFWEAPAQPAARGPAAPAARTAAQVVGKEQTLAQSQTRRANAAPGGTGRPGAWQAVTSRPSANVQTLKPVAAVPAQQPQSVIAGELEPEIFRNSPDFRDWCMKEMERLQGNENVLVVLLETGANFEIMEIARSNLKGDNIGAFVAEFIKRKANAQTAKAPGRRRRRGGAAAAAAPAPVAAPAPSQVDAAVHVGDGFVAVAGRGKAWKKKGGQSTAPHNGPRPGGNAFAMLPSM